MEFNEFLKVINDIASVFRGLTYYKNNFITSTIDVEKPVSYLFNNSNGALPQLGNVHVGSTVGIKYL